MNTSVSIKQSVKVAALTVAFTASGSAMALAGTGPSTSGNHSILGGNQIGIPISIPVSVCGNALALLGDAFGACEGGSSVSGGSGGGGSATTSGNGSIGGGNQVSAPISVPVSICGNSVAVLGHAGSGCKGGATVTGGSSGGHATTSGNHSIGGGNQVGVPISVPVDVCGISVAVLGRAGSSCKGGASTGGTGGSGGGSTSGNGSVGGGNQVGVPISVPVDVCGISVGVLGDANSGCQGGSHTGPPPPHHHHHHMPPPGHHHHHHHTPPPGRHHHHRQHHHAGSGSTVTARRIPPASVSGGSLPITGANFLGLLALAGGAIVSGAGAMAFAAKRGLVHGLVAFTRRVATVR